MLLLLLLLSWSIGCVQFFYLLQFGWCICRVCSQPHLSFTLGIRRPLCVPIAASSFSFCRPAVEYRGIPEDFKRQLSRRTGGNLTWHDGRGQKSAGGRTVKLLQQPGTGASQVLLGTWGPARRSAPQPPVGTTAAHPLIQESPGLRCDGKGRDASFIG